MSGKLRDVKRRIREEEEEPQEVMEEVF